MSIVSESREQPTQVENTIHSSGKQLRNWLLLKALYLIYELVRH